MSKKPKKEYTEADFNASRGRFVWDDIDQLIPRPDLKIVVPVRTPEEIAASIERFRREQSKKVEP